MHLAQLNVARLRAPMDDPLIDDFRNNLAPINALAEASPGYVWRLQDDSGDATSIKPFGDELEIVNLTVWESIDALADFTYRTGHVEFLRRRRDFFEAPIAADPVPLVDPGGDDPHRGGRDRAPRRTSGRTGRRRPPSPSATASSPATTTAQPGSDATPVPPERAPMSRRPRLRPYVSHHHPGGTMAFHPYLFFGGNCREAFTRYQEIFGGELILVASADMPPEEQVPDAPADSIMHAALTSDGVLLMGSDDPTSDTVGPVQGIQVNYSVDGVDEAKRAFDALAEGGEVTCRSSRPRSRPPSGCAPTGSASRGCSPPTSRPRPPEPRSPEGERRLGRRPPSRGI